MTEACAWGASEHGCDVDVRVEELFRGYRAAEGLARRWRSPRRGCAGPGSSRSGSRSAAAATPTRCASTASTASCSPTAPTRPTPPTSSVPAASLDEMLEVCEGIVAAAARVSGGRLKLRRGGRRRSSTARRSRSTASGGRPGPTRRCSARCEAGDEVIVNVAALDLGLGSGGFDIVHVNLTRGLEGGGAACGSRR